MDDLGNIVYILAAIGWFFWNAYRKSQAGKKAEDKTIPTNDTSENERGLFESLEDLVQEQFGDENEPEPEPVVAEVKSTSVPNAQKTSMQPGVEYVMSEGEMGSHRNKKPQKRIEVKELENEKSLMDEMFPEEGFDLRKAVVLNAILERPYK